MKTNIALFLMFVWMTVLTAIVVYIDCRLVEIEALAERVLTFIGG